MRLIEFCFPTDAGTLPNSVLEVDRDSAADLPGRPLVVALVPHQPGLAVHDRLRPGRVDTDLVVGLTLPDHVVDRVGGVVSGGSLAWAAGAGRRAPGTHARAAAAHQHDDQDHEDDYEDDGQDDGQQGGLDLDSGALRGDQGYVVRILICNKHAYYVRTVHTII